MKSLMTVLWTFCLRCGNGCRQKQRNPSLFAFQNLVQQSRKAWIYHSKKEKKIHLKKYEILIMLHLVIDNQYCEILGIVTNHCNYCIIRYIYRMNNKKNRLSISIKMHSEIFEFMQDEWSVHCEYCKK